MISRIQEAFSPKPPSSTPQPPQEDCLPCRAIGASAFIGLGTYGYISGTRQLRDLAPEIRRTRPFWGMRSRRVGVVVTSGMLVGVGVYRLVM
ncbi:hypothetical protein P152DRAFT_469980 [Eremomyces bilateralis CBS 781.70]|uniref:Distal membrane-arm assembly complex protein 1-like domain-containing protein n=1 Tax=Eremomyces bilateralis CBS 781.70 TaxID=1392243 RepID=A0A6G1GHW7_9PEZI|nr:uncharacterized protein P152DRAFT_469980 [Eremomyces bilateralis CBS 781.70]KAF1817572.1 hypothetical protein P152DRAFT_469980 [Eremomyces bilateralis CBS 781.70]